MLYYLFYKKIEQEHVSSEAIVDFLYVCCFHNTLDYEKDAIKILIRRPITPVFLCTIQTTIPSTVSCRMITYFTISNVFMFFPVLQSKWL